MSTPHASRLSPRTSAPRFPASRPSTKSTPRALLARFPVADARRPPFPTAYATRSNVIRKLKKPGGGLTVHYVKKKTKGPQTPSGDNGRIHGVSSAPSRFLGLLCGIAHGQPENGTIPTFRPCAPRNRAPYTSRDIYPRVHADLDPSHDPLHHHRFPASLRSSTAASTWRRTKSL